MASYKIVPNVGGDPFPGSTNRQSLYGWSVTASNACVVNFRDGSVSGSIVATASTAAAGSQVVFLDQGVSFDQGIYVEVSSGTLTNIAIYVD